MEIPDSKPIFLGLTVLIAIAAGFYLIGGGDDSDDDNLTLYGNIDLREVALSFMV